MVPPEPHHFQDLAVTLRPARCLSTSAGSGSPSPQYTSTRLRTLARARRSTLAHTHAPAKRPLCPLCAHEWLPGSATEVCRVGVAQTSLRGSSGACHRLPCSPRSMSVPPRSRRSARRAPPRRSALRAPPAAAAQSPPRALAPPSREPVPGVTDHLTATCALRHVDAGGGSGPES